MMLKFYAQVDMGDTQLII